VRLDSILGRTLLALAAVWLLGWGIGGIAIAGEVDEGTDAAESSVEDGDGDESDPVLFERVRVTGSPDKVRTIPGSVTYLDAETLERQDYSNVHRVLSLVPGVHVQEEEGYGLRPNIGMRGSGSERSSKITTMEDGVLIAPAPYSAPSAYYFPTMGRMEGVEVRKGSGSIQNGPFTTGGVLNFVSSSIPTDFGGKLSFAFGENQTLRGHLKFGDSVGRFGWLVEMYQYDTEGFKQLDGGGETGFDLQDYMVKLRYLSAPEAATFRTLELKLGKTRQSGSETYLGLTQEDFEANPYRRYAASRQDVIDTDHDQIVARYLTRPNRTVDFTFVVYRNDFYRNWHKLQSVKDQSDPDPEAYVGIASVMDDPIGRADELSILRADLVADSADDALRIRNNRRDYYSQGIQGVVGITPGGATSSHDIEIGVRYHEDGEDRFQEEDGFRISAAGLMQRTSAGSPGSQSNRVTTAQSLSLFVKDTMTLGDWIVTPGVRFETIDFTRTDYADADRSSVSGARDSSLNEIIPGVGASYRLSATSRLFGGIHRGFAPPGPSADDDTEAEKSVNYELGYRRDDPLFSSTVIGFYNDYENLLGACTDSSGCVSGEIGDQFNGGKVKVYGLEAGIGYDLGRRLESRFRIPIDLAYTYTRGEFRNSFESDYDAWGSVAAGDELPYLPEHQVSLGFGLRDAVWSAFANVIYADSMRTEAGQGPVPRLESTDSHLLVDLSGSYTWKSKLRLFVQVQNLTNEAYVAARRPAGARPGIDRTLLAGISYLF
jgi:Fe(3+) dicitrate transport protein